MYAGTNTAAACEPSRPAFKRAPFAGSDTEPSPHTHKLGQLGHTASCRVLSCVLRDTPAFPLSDGKDLAERRVAVLASRLGVYSLTGGVPTATRAVVTQGTVSLAPLSMARAVLHAVHMCVATMMVCLDAAAGAGAGAGVTCFSVCGYQCPRHARATPTHLSHGSHPFIHLSRRLRRA